MIHSHSGCWGFGFDCIGLMNRLNQSMIVFSVMMIECDCQCWEWRMYSNNNNHDKPPRSWLVTLSQTLIIDSNTKSAIPSSLSIDISRWNNNIQEREWWWWLPISRLISISFVSVIVLVPSTRFKQSSRSNNELCK